MCREYRPDYPVKQGIPLNEGTLSTMSDKEKSFWLDFLEEAKKAIDEKEKKEETRPYVPPKSLQEKFQKAISKYDGEKYCQIQQLKDTFRF